MSMTGAQSPNLLTNYMIMINVARLATRANAEPAVFKLGAALSEPPVEDALPPLLVAEISPRLKVGVPGRPSKDCVASDAGGSVASADAGASKSVLVLGQPGIVVPEGMAVMASPVTSVLA
jgi:hypothetical protein